LREIERKKEKERERARERERERERKERKRHKYDYLGEICMDVMGKCNTECSSIHLAIHNFMRITLRSKINFFHERQALSYNNNFLKNAEKKQTAHLFVKNLMYNHNSAKLLTRTLLCIYC